VVRDRSLSRSSSGLVPDPGTWHTVLDAVAARLGDRFDRLRAGGAALTQDASIELALAVDKSVAERAVASAQS